MRKNDLIQKFEEFFLNPNIQEKGELVLAAYFAEFIATQIHDEHEQTSITPMLSRYIAAAMRCLREEVDDQYIIHVRKLYLAAREQKEITDLTGTSPLNAEQEALITFVSQLMGKVTSDDLVEQLVAAYLRSPVARNARIRELYKALTNLVEKEQTASSLRQAENEAKQKLRDAYREHLRAEMAATRANMFIVERMVDKIKSVKQIFTNLFDNEPFGFTVQEPLFASAYKRGGYPYDSKYKGYLFVFQGGKTSDTWEGIRQQLALTSKKPSFCYSTWEDVVLFYIGVHQSNWFAINRDYLRNWNNWTCTTKAVMWETTTRGDSDEGYYVQPTITEEAISLRVWELPQGAEYSCFYSGMLENELEKRMQEFEKSSYLRRDDLPSHYLRDDEYYPTNSLADTSITKKTQDAENLLREAKRKTATFSIQYSQKMEEQKNDTQRELSVLFQEQAGNTQTQYWFQQGQTVFGSYTEAQMLAYIANNTVVSNTQVNVNGAGWIAANQILAFQDALTMPQVHILSQQYGDYRY